MPRQNKVEEIRVRVTPDEKKRYEDLAEFKNKTLSELIRFLLEVEYEKYCTQNKT